MTQSHDVNLIQSQATGTAVFSTTRWGRNEWLAAGGLFVVVAGLYLRDVKFRFVNFDDQAYIYSNVRMITGFTLANLRYALTSTVNGNWHPLTTLVWLILASVFGVNAGPFHLLNLLLHAINAVMLFAFLKRSTGRLRLAFFAAALWALHPLRVESVAWACELKDTLCGTMWLASMLCYLRYASHRTPGRYAMVLMFFVLALLSKPVAVVLPFLLLLLDYWPLQGSDRSFSQKWWRLRLAEKLPLMVLSVAAMLVEIHAQRAAHLNASPILYPLDLRLKNAAVSYIAYLRDTVYPAHLTAFYPHPAVVAGAGISWAAAASAAGVLLLVSVLVCMRARVRPYLFVGWFWFLGTLVPNIGIVQSGDQARADRFTYFSAMGLAIFITWAIADIVDAWPRLRSAAYAVGAAALVAVTFVSNNYLGYWYDGTTLFTHMLQVQPNNFMALCIAGDQFQVAGDIPKALEYEKKSLTIAPTCAPARIKYAFCLRQAGQLAEAVEQINLALTHDPYSGDGWDCKGSIFDKRANEAQARHDTAAEKILRERATTYFRLALQFAPDMVEAGEHLAYELAAQGKLDEAIAEWKIVLDKMPTYGQAQGDLADALRMQQDLPGAVEHYRAAVSAGSKKPEWEAELAYLVATSPQASLADVESLIPIAKDACDQTGNRSPAALDAYAVCLARVGRINDAITTARQGVAQANAAHDPRVAAGIQRRLELYERGLPYVMEPVTSQPSATQTGE